MRKRQRASRLVAGMVGGLLTVAAVAGGALALFTEVNAAPRCICPKVYAPVVCDNGKTYPNLCVANCKRAKNCVPIPLLPPPM